MTAPLKPAPPRKLTDKQRRFVEAYVGPAAGDMAKAAKLAGYGNARSTVQSLSTMGRRTMQSPAVREYLDTFHRKSAEAAQVTADEVMRRLATIARARPIDAFEHYEPAESVVVDTLDDVPDHLVPHIVEVTQLGTSGKKYVRFEALRLKHLASMPDDVREAIAEVSVGKSGALRIKWHDRIAADRLIGQAIGMFVEKHEIKTTDASVRVYIPDNGRGPKREGDK